MVQGGDAAPPVYELRAYQLILGYNPVPEMRKAFSVGCVSDAPVCKELVHELWIPIADCFHLSIPAKLSCNAEGQLAFIAYSEVGCVAFPSSGASLSRLSK